MLHATAQKRIRIGCQSWGYEDWITPPGDPYVFYPPGTRKSDMLEFYSQVFDTIEVDATVYGTPAASTLEKWYSETPANFVFSLKTPREITHEGRLTAATIPVMREFVERCTLLGKKLGVILIQLPSSFDGSLENGQNLRDFLAGLPRGIAYAIEFRNRDWFVDWTFRELRQNDTALALVEGPWLPRELVFEAARKYEIEFSYIRIMAERDLTKFDRIYRRHDEILQQWADEIGRLHASEVYVYIDNYFEGFAPGTAARVQQFLGIPAKHAEDFQEQPSLFD
jgi:uncharacterized protein YecE (DUF72 family)